MGVYAPEHADCLRDGNLGDLPGSVLEEMIDSGLLIAADVNESVEAEQTYFRRRASNPYLGVIVEMGQACNLACGYCYQNEYRDSESTLTTELVEGVVSYIHDVARDQESRPVRSFTLGLIGGEPLLQKQRMFELIDATRQAVRAEGWEFGVNINTNGLLLDEQVIREIDRISVTLTNQGDHDLMRPRHNGAGSYSQIVKRLKRHAEHFNLYRTQLSVRYNANALNASYITDVYRMVKEDLGIERTAFELQPTINHDGNILVPTLSRQAFAARYLELNRLKLEYGESLSDFPFPTFSPCAAYSPGNLKVTATGELALCDSFTSPVGGRGAIHEASTRYGEFFEDYHSHNPFHDPDCGNCANVGICGGKLLCKDDLDVTSPTGPCNSLPFELDDYLRFFVDVFPRHANKFRQWRVLGEAAKSAEKVTVRAER